MMKRWCAVMAVLCLGAGAGPRVSILGDSYSTFREYIPEGNDSWYPASTNRHNDVKTVEETWWWQVVAACGGTLEVNDSYSGATICYAGYKKGLPHHRDYSDRAFVTRATRLGHPDLILVCGGTNDDWAGSPLGTNVWADWTTADLWTLRGGLAKTLATLREAYPTGRVAFVLNCDLKPSTGEAVHDVCAHYAVPCVDLHGIAKQASHPSAAGMAAMARQVTAALTAKRLGELFLTTDPTLYKPQGYAGGKAYGGGQLVHYATASLWVNALACARLTHDADLEARLVAAFTPYYKEKASVMNDIRHVDLAIVGAVPLEIAALTGDAQARALGLRYADRQWEEPREGLDWGERWYDKIPLAERRDWWEKGYSPQTRLWIDDMYMITVLQTQAYRATGDYKYVERAAREMCLYLERLPREDGLFNHAPGALFAWGRGNGWMAAAMPMLLRDLKPSDPSRPVILAGYRKMMAALLGHQRESGLWGQIVDDPESWDETSASAMFAYALQEGLNQRLFEGPEAPWCRDESISAAVARAFAALVAKLDEHGNLADVCAGTGWRNDRAHYLNRPRVNGDPHGQAPLLWLCRAILEPAP